MVSNDEFKKSMSRFAAGVTVITYNDGEKYGAVTVSSFTSLSLDPPLVLFNLIKGTSSHDRITQSNNFIVHILAKGQEEISNSFASSKIDKDAYIRNLGFTIENNLPVLADALSVLVCEKEIIYDGGDHSIIIGKVLSANTDESKSPLLYFNKGYHTIQ
jgi:flavin reductase (DIM6/NTAB) family NADH-FMN oxidoreductase RutF